MKKTEEEFVKWFDQQDYKSVPVLYNPDGSAFADYQVRSIPTEVFIDSHGENWTCPIRGYFKRRC